MTDTQQSGAESALDLLPCPFCGGEAHATTGFTTHGDWPYGDFHRIFCGVCQNRQLFHRTKAEAVGAWNRRATAPHAAAPATGALVAKQPHQEPVGHVKDHFKGTDKAYRTVIWAGRTFAMDVPDGAPLYAAPTESAAALADPNAVADYVADNWPMKKYTLEEIETRLRALATQQPTTQGEKS